MARRFSAEKFFFLLLITVMAISWLRHRPPSVQRVLVGLASASPGVAAESSRRLTCLPLDRVAAALIELESAKDSAAKRKLAPAVEEILPVKIPLAWEKHRQAELAASTLGESLLPYLSDYLNRSDTTVPAAELLISISMSGTGDKALLSLASALTNANEQIWQTAVGALLRIQANANLRSRFGAGQKGIGPIVQILSRHTNGIDLKRSEAIRDLLSTVRSQ